MTGFELKRLVESTPTSQQETPEYALWLNDLAVHCHHSNFAEADGYYQRSRDIWERTLGPNHPWVAQSLFNHSALCRKMKIFAEAEREFQLAERIARINRKVVAADPHPLKAEHYSQPGVLEQFGTDVRNLRAAVDAGSVEAKAELAVTLERLGPWYHNLRFAGRMTNPATPDYPASRLRLLDEMMPKDLSGKTVLDIGCNSGFFSIEMKKRGAERVVGVDIMHYLLAQARFTSHWFGLPVELHESSAYDVDQFDMKFDVVLFIGVLYHLKHPLLALEKIASICKDTMYLASVVRGSKGDFEPADDYPGTEVKIFEDPHYPRLYFIEKSIDGDESNWWYATRSCLKAMARTAGFKSVEETSHPEYLICRK